MKPWVSIADVLGNTAFDANGDHYRVGRNAGATEQARGNRPYHDTSRPAHTLMASGPHDFIGPDYQPSSEASRSDARERQMTPDESALLQSFTEDYDFHGNKSSLHRQIGNAVPPKLAKAIGERVMETLDCGVKPHVTVADILGVDAYDEDGTPYWTTSPSGDGYQVNGRDPFRTTEEASFTHTGRYVRLIPQSFEPNEDATPAGAQTRRLTQDEMALLQSFPADYAWRGNGIMRQQGNAVPPLLARAIGEQVMETLNGEQADITGQTTLIDHGFALAD